MKFHFFREIPSDEKRTLAQLPAISSPLLPNFHPFLTAYEKYFYDNFGFRNNFVRLNSIINYSLGSSPSNAVILGKQGWLFYNHPKDGIHIKDYSGNAKFSEKELLLIKKKIEHLAKEFKKRNITFILTLAPNKHTIYDRFLPSYLRNSGVVNTRADQLNRIFSDSPVHYIDLRQVLRNKSNDDKCPTYFLTDTHWNSLGAFYAYEKIINSIKTKHGQIKALTLEDFTISLRHKKGTGDLASMINMKGCLSDIKIDLIPRNKSKVSHVDGESAKKGLTYTTQEDHLPTLMLYGDSFSHGLIPFFSENFSKTILIQAKSMNFAQIIKNKTNVVVFEFVERYSYLLMRNLATNL